MLNALDQTKACRAAMDLSTEWIKKKKCRIKFNTQFSIYKNLSNKILDYYEKYNINQYCLFQ